MMILTEKPLWAFLLVVLLHTVDASFSRPAEISERWSEEQESQAMELADSFFELSQKEKVEGRLSKGMAYLQSAIKVAEENQLSIDVKAHYYFRLGRLYVIMDEKDKAAQYLKYAGVLAEKIGDKALITACDLSLQDGIGSSKGITEGFSLSKGEMVLTLSSVSLLLTLVVFIAFGKWQEVKLDPSAKENTKAIETTSNSDETETPLNGQYVETLSAPKRSVWIREKNKRWIQVEVADILNIEARNNNVDLYTKQKTYKEIGVSLLNMSRQLQYSGFIRTHRSHLVNVSHLKIIEDNCIFLTKGKVPIGESYRKELFDKLHLLRSTGPDAKSALENTAHAQS